MKLSAGEEDKLLSIAIEEVERFIADNNHAASLSQKIAIEASIRAFVTSACARCGGAHMTRFAIVTSGGTVAPLEQQEIRHVTNLSTGQHVGRALPAPRLLCAFPPQDGIASALRQALSEWPFSR